MTEISRRVAPGPPRAASVCRASALLPAAGAYDPSPTWYEIPLGADRVSLAYAYTLTSPSATGYAAIRPQFKSADIPGVIFRDVDMDAPVVAGALVRRPVKELQIDLPVPPVDVVSDVVVLRVPPGMIHVAFPAAEVGDTANRGTLVLWALTGL